MSENKPRVRVKMRRMTILRVGGVSRVLGGYDKAFCCQLGKLFDRGRVFSIKLLARNGDYDKYAVIHD